jgi:hypothetical protein
VNSTYSGLKDEWIVIKKLLDQDGGPNGNRTRVSGVRGQRPRPLDDGTMLGEASDWKLKIVS